MNHKHRHQTPIRLGRGHPLTPEALADLWQVVTSRNPANDWARGRVLTMLITTVVIGWGLTGITNLIVAELGAEPGPQLLFGDDFDSPTGNETTVAGVAGTREGLQNNLFRIPQAPKKPTTRKPKTNPVELLGLIELQGVLGGSNPRAIILYKRSKKTVTVSVGDDLGEFKVMEIRERGVILKWRDELFELSL